MRRQFRLGTIAALAAGAMALAAGTVIGAGAAQAQPAEAGPVTGEAITQEGLKLRGLMDGEEWDVWAHVLGMVPDGSEAEEALLVYCIDIRTDLDTESPYAEGDWEESEVPNLDLVRWVLFNGYPNIGSGQLFEASSFDQPGSWTGEDSRLLAYVATQAAVWHFTDGFELDLDQPLADGTAEENKAVTAVYKHLTEDAGRLPDPSEFYIDLEGVDEAGYADGAFGPYRVRSTAGPVAMSADGGNLVDASGKPIESLDDGGEFYIVLDEGSTEITISGNATYDLPVGRVFLATTNEAIDQEVAASTLTRNGSQKLILAEPREGEVPAEWAFVLEVPEADQPSADTAVPAPQPQLPTTGSNLTIAFAGGLALLIGGMTVLTLARRKQSEH